MRSLKLSSGLEIGFDASSEKFYFPENMVCQRASKIKLSSILPGLLNKTLRYPKFVYYEFENIRHKEHDAKFTDPDYKYDLVMLPSGLMGVEYIRSHIYFAESCGEKVEISEIVEVHHGKLSILLQRNRPEPGEVIEKKAVSEGLVVKVKQGEKFCIPTGYYYTFINTTSKPTVFTRLYDSKNRCDYSKLKSEKGLAYFAIKKNARQEIVLNPRYREIPKIKNIPAGETPHMQRIPLPDRPLYEMIMENGKKLSSWF